MKNQKVAVVGVGAIGGVAAASLSELGRDELFLCVRTPFDQLVVDHSNGSTKVEAKIISEPADAPVCDWILLATKAHQTPDAKPWLDALCGPASRVAVLQNGIDHVERVAPLLDAKSAIVPVVVQLPAEKKAPGHVVQQNDGVLLVADDENGLAFAELFEGARTSVRTIPTFLDQAWWKLMMNAALGGVCALAIRENGIAGEPEMREVVLGLMREIVQVARAEGANLPDDAPEKALSGVLRGAGDHWSSISVDRREGRPMEWEVRNAVIGRLARRHQLETPLNDAITALLRAADVTS